MHVHMHATCLHNMYTQHTCTHNITYINFSTTQIILIACIATSILHEKVSCMPTSVRQSLNISEAINKSMGLFPIRNHHDIIYSGILET